MKFILNLTVLLIASCGILAADVPRKPLPSKYRSLWTNSPFTTKPVTTPGKPYNALQDYVVMGVGPADDGYRVTLLNSKRPNDGRFIVKTGKPNSKGIVVEEVIRQGGDRQEDGTRPTKVRISDGQGNTATIGFESKFLAIKAPAPAAAPQPARVGNPSTNQNNKGQQRPPRQRIIPPRPPTPGSQNNNSSNRSNQGNTSRRVVPNNRGNSGR